MPAKRIGTPVLVRLPDDMLRQIDERRAETGQTRAEAVRRMLGYALDKASTKRGRP